MTELHHPLSPDVGPHSRLEVLHATLFTFGFFLSFVGLVAGIPEVFLVSGPCLMLSAVLIWFGVRVTFAGKIGGVLRAALGPARLLSIHARALAWLLIGLALTGWGVVGFARDSYRDFIPFPPLVSQSQMTR